MLWIFPCSVSGSASWASNLSQHSYTSPHGTGLNIIFGVQPVPISFSYLCLFFCKWSFHQSSLFPNNFFCILKNYRARKIKYVTYFIVTSNWCSFQWWELSENKKVTICSFLQQGEHLKLDQIIRDCIIYKYIISHIFLYIGFTWISVMISASPVVWHLL